ncbi:DUF4435 domain-containing protein [Parabacteroides sp.]
MSQEESEFYKLEAKRYKASLSVNGHLAVVYLEDKGDECFWAAVLKHYKADSSFYFRFGSRETGSGCQQCLKYKKHLDKQFLIAIDSDYRYLLKEADVDVAHFVLQTYTYSFENHYCYAKNLQKALRLACNDDKVDDLFSVSEFLRQYGEIVYPLFLYLLYDMRTKKHVFLKDEFHQLLGTQTKVKQSVEDNGKTLLDSLHQTLNKKLSELKALFPDFTQEAEASLYKEAGLHKDTAYLYARGHNLYNIIVSLGKEIVNYHIREEKKKCEKKHHKAIYERHSDFEPILRSQLLYNYPEMEKIGKDIKKIWQ